jgi:hypothetical protein
MISTLRPFLLFFSILVLHPRALSAGELYYTGFENFSTGNDTIAGTEDWTGSAPHAGLELSGVDPESEHLVLGIGNAAFIGGNAIVLPPTITSRTVNVRHRFNADPVGQNQEVVQFHVTFGIKDSTFTGMNPRRDNFEFAFYNFNPANPNGSNYLLAFIQFDNTTLDMLTQAPAQKIWRSNWNSATVRFDKVDTGTTFFYDVLMELQVRINFRTNRWTASLDGLDIFADVPFYTGTQPRNLGLVAAQMQIVNAVQINTQTHLAPGDNYMLFDDFAARMDPVPAPFFYTFEHLSNNTVQLTWLNEALYNYQVQYTDDLALPWKNDLPNSFFTPTVTGKSPLFTDSTAAGVTRRFYRVQRTVP